METPRVGPAALEVIAELASKKRLVRLGLAGWILRRYEHGLLSPAEAAAMLNDAISALGGAVGVWNAIGEAFRGDASEGLGWSNWILHDKDGAPGSIDVYPFLWRLFVLAACRAAEPHGLELEGNPAGRWALRGSDASLRRALEQVAKDPEELYGALGARPSARILNLIETAVEAAAAKEEGRETDDLIRAPLDARLVNRTMDEIWTEFERRAVMRTLVGGSIAPSGESPPAEALTFGYYVLDPKEPYVEPSGRSNAEWGHHYGRGLAEAEDEMVVRALIKESSLIEAADGRGIWMKTLSDAVEELNQSSPCCVILAGAPGVLWELDSLEEFKRKRNSTGGQVGTLHGSPVYAVAGEVEASALLFRTGEGGNLVHYRPEAKLEEERECGPGLWCGVEAISSECAQAMLNDDPALIQQYGAGDTSEALRRLQTHVKLRVTMCARFRTEGIVSRVAIEESSSRASEP